MTLEERITKLENQVDGAVYLYQLRTEYAIAYGIALERVMHRIKTITPNGNWTYDAVQSWAKEIDNLLHGRSPTLDELIRIEKPDTKLDNLPF